MVLIVCIYYTIRLYQETSFYRKKYSKIIDIEKVYTEKAKEIRVAELRIQSLRDLYKRKNQDFDLITTREELKQEIESIRSLYKEKKMVFDNLDREINIYRDDLEYINMGLYQPHFDFDTSEKFKQTILEVRQKQKTMLKQQIAFRSLINWQVDGSASKGKQMTNRAKRLTARAFNNECDAAIANARWNNVDKMEARIMKAFDDINKLNESNQIVISEDYLNLKLDELHLTHEYKEKKQEEKNEQYEIQRQIREEQKLQKEIGEAIKNEKKYNQILEKAKLEADKASGEKLEKLKESIAILERQLAEAQEKSQRAISMAEQTKKGFVYVISNIGSFGENIYKIGMTRRLEPEIRIRELSSASVPFVFDVHAMILSDNAPELENTLHKKFDGKRVNLVNNRKEFFSVTLDEIKNEVAELNPEADFIETAEARELRETQILRKKMGIIQVNLKKEMNVFPDSI
mgnify:FL=1